MLISPTILSAADILPAHGSDVCSGLPLVRKSVSMGSELWPPPGNVSRMTVIGRYSLGTLVI